MDCSSAFSSTEEMQDLFHLIKNIINKSKDSKLDEAMKGGWMKDGWTSLHTNSGVKVHKKNGSTEIN